MPDTMKGNFQKDASLIEGEHFVEDKEENWFLNTPFEKWWGVGKMVGINKMWGWEKFILRWGIILSVSYFLVFDDFVQWFFIVKN